MAVQIKLFYNIAFDEDKCQVIFLNPESLPTTHEELLERTRERIEALRFIPNSELRLQYHDDEGTLVHLREDDDLNEVWRCAKHVQGTEFRRVKIKIIWQPKTTPEMLLSKRREMAATSNNADNSMSQPKGKKHLNFVESSQGKTSVVHSSNTENAKKADTPLPSKKQRLDPTSRTQSSHNLTAEYLSPLDLLIRDMQRDIAEQQNKISQTEKELRYLYNLYGHKPNIDYMKPACTNCHRREGHNRVNCPYKGHACLSAEFCGDMNKHKNEKDIVSEKNNLLQIQKKTLEKLQNNLASKVVLKNQVTNSFSSIMRSRLINDCKPRYINSVGFENWRQINIDLKKLESHFKGKIPPPDVNLIEALEEYENKIRQPLNRSDVTSNPMRTLWEMKGLKWPSTSGPSTSGSSSEIQDQLATAIQDSRLHTGSASGTSTISSSSSTGN